ncbi:uncharacterized protein [Aristolochia californica]|uniref:uncharacterized protein n=1 Tax=Aristolochia californica TaxID=171875 RepID=UPI0035DCD667
MGYFDRTGQSSLAETSRHYEEHLQQGHRDLSFSLGDYVWLRLRHYRQLSVTASKRHKLSLKFYGPFQVLHCIGSVAYRLQLPPDAKIHDVFHVSLLKPFRGDSPMLHTPLPPIQDGHVLPTPEKVFQARRVQGLWEILVQWADKDLVDVS